MYVCVSSLDSILRKRALAVFCFCVSMHVCMYKFARFYSTREGAGCGQSRLPMGGKSFHKLGTNADSWSLKGYGDIVTRFYNGKQATSITAGAECLGFRMGLLLRAPADSSPSSLVKALVLCTEGDVARFD